MAITSLSVWIAFVVIGLLEMLIAARAGKTLPGGLSDDSRLGRNLGLGVTYRLIATPLLLTPLLALAHRDAAWRLAVPAALSWAISLLAIDLINYATHVAGHKVPFLWRFHRTHHADEKLDASTGLRVHFGEKIFFLPAKVLVVYSLGIPTLHYIVYEVIASSFGVLHHASLGIPERLEAQMTKLLALPRFHRLHHHLRMPETDTNYGFVLSVWDRIFGTHSGREATFEPEFGLDTFPDTNLFGLLCAPLLPITKPVATVQTARESGYDLAELSR